MYLFIMVMMINQSDINMVSVLFLEIIKFIILNTIRNPNSINFFSNSSSLDLSLFGYYSFRTS